MRRRFGGFGSRWDADRARETTVLELYRRVVHELFPALRRKGILARANPGDCLSCGGAVMDDVAKAAKARGRRVVGTVYFHRQDTAGLMEFHARKDDDVPTLPLAFTGEAKDGSDTAFVGGAVYALLDGAALETDWDGDPSKRIFIRLKKGTEAEQWSGGKPFVPAPAPA